MSTDFTDIYGYQEQGQNALNQLAGMESGFKGLNTTRQVRSKFGITDPSQMFTPLFQNLATNRARQLAGAGMRAGRSASPEMTFSNIEEGYGNALSSLLGEKARSSQEQERFVAGLLGQSLGSQDEFGLRKTGQMGNMANQLAQTGIGLKQAEYATREPSLFDILSTILAGGVDVAGKFAGAPRSTFNF